MCRSYKEQNNCRKRVRLEPGAFEKDLTRVSARANLPHTAHQLLSLSAQPHLFPSHHHHRYTSSSFSSQNIASSYSSSKHQVSMCQKLLLALQVAYQPDFLRRSPLLPPDQLHHGKGREVLRSPLWFVKRIESTRSRVFVHSSHRSHPSSSQVASPESTRTGRCEGADRSLLQQLPQVVRHDERGC